MTEKPWSWSSELHGVLSCASSLKADLISSRAWRAARCTACAPRSPTTAWQPGTGLSRQDITALIEEITDIMALLRAARTANKAELYARLGLRLTYKPGARKVIAQATPGRSCTKGSCPRGDLNPHALLGH